METFRTFSEKSLNIEAEETQLLKDLLKKQNTQLIYSRIAGIAVSAMALILLVSCIIIVPQVVNTLNKVNGIIEQAESTINEVDTTIASLEDTVNSFDTTLDSINKMSEEITTAAEGINGLVDENSQVLTEAMAKINGIDFDGLNSAIVDLQAVIEPLAKFANKFR